jgi:hypothetical protein
MKIRPLIVNKFNFWVEGEGEQGGVKGGAKKKEEYELKEKIDMKVSTKFRWIRLHTAEKITFKVIWGWTDRLTDQQMNKLTNQLNNQPTNQPTEQRTKSLIDAICSHLKIF